MEKLKIQELTAEAFEPYGTFFDINAGYGDGEIEFIADRMFQYIGVSGYDSLCSIRVKDRPLELSVTEYHEYVEEVSGGFDEDVAVHVGLLDKNGEIDYDSIKVFRLPKGCFIRVKRNVLHHAAFALDGKTATGLILLSPSAYTVDCKVLEYKEIIPFEA